MNLHAQIMNLPDQCDPAGDSDPFCRGYKHGHRDARHAAAELALSADAINAELLAALNATLSFCRPQTGHEMDSYHAARAAVAKAVQP